MCNPCILTISLRVGFSEVECEMEAGEQAAQSHTVFVDKPPGTCARSCKILDCSTHRGTSIQRDTLWDAEADFKTLRIKVSHVKS